MSGLFLSVLYASLNFSNALEYNFDALSVLFFSSNFLALTTSFFASLYLSK